MERMKPAPQTINMANAMSYFIYGMDVPTVRRKLQVEKRKVKTAQARVKKEVNANVAFDLKPDHTVEQIAVILNITVDDVIKILKKKRQVA